MPQMPNTVPGECRAKTFSVIQRSEDAVRIKQITEDSRFRGLLFRTGCEKAEIAAEHFPGTKDKQRYLMPRCRVSAGSVTTYESTGRWFLVASHRLRSSATSMSKPWSASITKKRVSGP